MTPLQLKARNRNSAKWIVAGAERGLRNLAKNSSLTMSEHDDIKRISIRLGDILSEWDENNKQLGIGRGGK